MRLSKLRVLTLAAATQGNLLTLKAWDRGSNKGAKALARA